MRNLTREERKRRKYDYSVRVAALCIGILPVLWIVYN